jgi:hypothetical protein
MDAKSIHQKLAKRREMAQMANRPLVRAAVERDQAMTASRRKDAAAQVQKSRPAASSDRVYTEEMGAPPVNMDGMPGTERIRKAPAKKMASGGYVRAADGCATKGKTKGTMVKMAMGGKTC